jgi:hypothetical protein
VLGPERVVRDFTFAVEEQNDVRPGQGLFRRFIGQLFPEEVGLLQIGRCDAMGLATARLHDGIAE